MKKFLFGLFLVNMIAGCLFLNSVGLADEEGYVYVLCNKYSTVCMREKPRKTSIEFGSALCGTVLKTDWKEKNGFIHVIDLLAEETSGWISTKYIVYEEPIWLDRTATVVSNGRLAARNCIGGKVKKWLQPMEEVTIYYWTSEWCVTNYGYVRTEFLELDGE